MDELERLFGLIKDNYYFKKNETQKENFINVMKRYAKSYSFLNDEKKQQAKHKLVDSLEDAHVLYSDQYNIAYPVNLKWFEDDLFIIGTHCNCLKIKKINGARISQIIENYHLLYPNSPSSLVKSIIRKNILFGFMGSEFVSTDGQSFSFLDDNFKGVTFVPPSVNPDSLKTGCYTKLYSNCLYIRIYHFLLDSLADFMTHILSSTNVENIIIDLRGNLGGKVNLTKKITSMFLDTPIDLHYYVQSKDERYRQVVKAGIIRDFQSIYILVDQNTRSSSEFIFLRSLSLAFKNIKIIGEKTFGLSGQVKHYTFPDFSISLTHRRYFDENDAELKDGVTPTEHRVNSLNDFINNFDSQLSYILQQMDIEEPVTLYKTISQ